MTRSKPLQLSDALQTSTTANTIFGHRPNNRLLAQLELRHRYSASSSPYNVFHLAALVLVVSADGISPSLADSGTNLAIVRQPDLGHFL